MSGAVSTDPTTMIEALRSAGDVTAPITLRMPCGGGIYGGQTHSQRPEALFTTMASTSSRPRSNA